MTGLGIFFAISGEQAKALSAASDDEELLVIVHSIALAAAEEDLVDTDGTWAPCTGRSPTAACSTATATTR